MMAVDYAAIAKQFGGSVEIPQQSNVSGYGAIMDGMSPEQQNKIRYDIYEADRKRLDGLGAEISQAEPLLTSLRRFRELNVKTGTGGGWDSYMFPNAKLIHSGETNEMRTIEGDAPQMRPAGSGTSSDKDISLYLKKLPSVDLGGVENGNIIDKYERQFQHAVEKKRFLQDYLNKNQSLMGADGEWRKSSTYQNYMNNKPLDSKAGNSQVKTFNPKTGKIE